jgi:hypothetical protein
MPVGVQQGDNMPPVLFLFFVQASTDTIEDDIPRQSSVISLNTRMEMEKP